MNHGIANRMSACLRRQIATYEEMVHAYTNLDHQVGKEDASELLAKQEQYSRQLHVLSREFEGLLGEWNKGAGIDAEAREQVALLAREAERLAHRLVRAEEHGAALADARRQEATTALAALRKGRNVLTGYRAGDANSAGYFDKNA